MAALFRAPLHTLTAQAETLILPALAALLLALAQ